jgi:hypothetical protein
MTSKLREWAGRWLGPVFALTRDEQRVLCIVVALALLGIAVRYWHRHVRSPVQPPSGLDAAGAEAGHRAAASPPGPEQGGEPRR